MSRKLRIQHSLLSPGPACGSLCPQQKQEQRNRYREPSRDRDQGSRSYRINAIDGNKGENERHTNIQENNVKETEKLRDRDRESQAEIEISEGKAALIYTKERLRDRQIDRKTESKIDTNIVKERN